MKALKISGRPIVYKDANGQPVSYPVYDGLSPEPFMETMLPGVANDPSGKRNTLLFINHRTDALPLASEKGKTMDISDTPSALCFTAELDPENSQARDLASTLSRQDLTAMSVGFRVLSDSWSDDWMTRTVRSIELLEISAVNHPASPARPYPWCRPSRRPRRRSGTTTTVDRRATRTRLTHMAARWLGTAPAPATSPAGRAPNAAPVPVLVASSSAPTSPARSRCEPSPCGYRVPRWCPRWRR